ncbi:putative 6-phosphogluconolactonase 4, chloroplastic [Tetrabaena socialis]|uniref:Putative 6-phosphogluconolactonase 4, chloroplastic n=1 Tax=Tetrabaena socialis TaxID=47790 RepID=A0A2J8A201_9CHLO|nr:putative 6-phosphogluconolactonase 4, chloroplastic [Tetrabaena socialis]|eukprot:PNH06542.1 putative 6-phosphogluconolactonase 4, chloroplastic [Tetrabaena socialis]
MVLSAAQSAVAERGVFLLAIPGGSVLKMCAGLAGLPVPWDKTLLFYVNHKCVPAGDKSSTHQKALDYFLTRVGAPLANVAALTGSADAPAEAREYEARLRQLLYKLCAATLLGGADGGGGSRAERRALRNSAAAPLPELHTDASFDPEQIWLQLELATDAAVRRVRRLIRTAEPLSAGTAQLVTAEALAGVEALLRGGGSSGEEEDEEGGSSDEEEEGEDEEEDEEEEEEERKRRAKKARKDGGKKAAAAGGGGGGMDDRFFRLSDMENQAPRQVVSGKGVRVAEGAGSKRHGRTDVGSSSAVFAKLAAEQAAAAAGGGLKAPKVGRELQQSKGAAGGAEGPRKGAAALKL